MAGWVGKWDTGVGSGRLELFHINLEKRPGKCFTLELNFYENVWHTFRPSPNSMKIYHCVLNIYTIYRNSFEFLGH